LENLNDARLILKILNREGFDAFIVGGAVRDHLLKMDLSDVDITTSAKPQEVLKFFKGVETGVKYGTVTIDFRKNKYEVTTFRSEEGYYDYRRPDFVKFVTDVKEDVLRRDFTINGLLMDSKGEIIDHVNGLKDLENKIIRTIGNPSDRFSEDALRMLRAFYFQSKLGFDIDLDTLKSISENKLLIKEVAAERVLDEMNKMVVGKHLVKALDSIVKTGVDKILPGLKKGINYLSETKQNPKPIIFYSLCFSLNNGIPSYWKFSNLYKHKLNQIVTLVNKNALFTNEDLYHYGLELVTLANEVKNVLKRPSQKEQDLENIYNNLVIKSSLDLKFRARDILNITNKKAGAWVNNLINEMVEKVINKELGNNYEELKTFVLNNYERF